MRYIKEYYNAASDGLFTLATPVLAGLVLQLNSLAVAFLSVVMTISILYLLVAK